MSGEGRSSNANQGNASGTTRSSGSGPCESGKKPPSESSNNDNNVSSQKKMTEQKFAPKQPRKAHSVACDQLNRRIVSFHARNGHMTKDWTLPICLDS